MLCELAATNLGVIGELSLVFGSGMTAVTGETGAGKTLVVEAIELLVGGRADASMVRAGSDETVIEGRFVVDDEEVVLRRVIPANGRSRAYVNGRLATVGELAEWGQGLVDLHGQHAHQSLLSKVVQRQALDRYAQLDLGPLAQARQKLAHAKQQLLAHGGDERERARELDLVRFQLTELESAGLDSPDEDEVLAAEENLLADALAHQAAARMALEALDAEIGARGQLAIALDALGDREPFREISKGLSAISIETGELSSQLRQLGEAIEDDPARLEQVRLRRNLLHELQRKYGRSLTEVIAFRDSLVERLADLENIDEVRERLDAEVRSASEDLRRIETEVGRSRREASPGLEDAVMAHLADLALPGAVVEIEIGDDPGDDVSYLISTNPGSPPLPLSKVASGGELARVMLALRLVLQEAPDTLIFDEVDAGIGGTAAIAVGKALAQLGSDHQVLVVTHLAQVAAAADNQVMVSKESINGETVTSASTVIGEERIVELARMLSGASDSSAALEHAKELLCRR